MSQSFPNITLNSYIDSGILALQDRDNATLTWFSGESAPANPFTNLVWNDTHNKRIKWYHNSSWETIIDYGKSYITTTNLSTSYQPLSSNLTTYSSVTVSGNGLITNQWVPLSSFFINKLWSGFKDNLGLGSLAYKNKLNSSDINDNTISKAKLSSDVVTDPAFKVGDVIPSFNQGNKGGCIKLSKTANSVFTVGAAASNSTYKGETYKNLFEFIWKNKFIKIYNSNGIEASKGNNWTTDWNNNKQLELPHIDIPEANVPADKTINGGSGSFKITKSGYYYLTLVSGGGGGAGNSAGTWGHQSLCCGAAGSGFKCEILLNENDIINYVVGAKGKKGGSYSDWGNTSQGTAGGNSTLRINNNLYLTCTGGGGGKTVSNKGNRGAAWIGYEPYGGAVTVHRTDKFVDLDKAIIRSRDPNAPRTKGLGDGYGTSSGNVIQVNGPFEQDGSYTWGKGGSAQGFGDNKPSVLGDGTAGYLNLKFLAPKEYGTSNSGVKTTLDNLYNSLTYFMKY